MSDTRERVRHNVHTSFQRNTTEEKSSKIVNPPSLSCSLARTIALVYARRSDH